MKTKLFLLGLLVSTMTMVGQTTNSTDSKKETWYFKLGGSYFIQTAATEFPVVGGQLPNRDVYAGTLTNNKLISRESVTGSFGEGFRSGITAGYRFSPRLGVELAANYYSSNSKTMAQTTDRLVTPSPTASTPVTYLSFTAEGQIKAFDLAPAIVMFLGESHGFEPYTKVGIIVPVHGTLEIETNRDYATFVGANQVANTVAYSKDVVKPNATVGFMAALGTSYKLGNHISAFAELEYRNFTVHGKTKETTEYTENGVDKLNTTTSFRKATYSTIHTDYVDHLDSNSNNSTYNSTGFDETKPMNELSSYVGISGLGFTLGLKYSL
ncbi:outer membrane beta-barrel protein [Flavobacterium sp. 5]|uniref:outer membrane beta-barrel protein n=1 Tax=Flavobacterium sp. 5 TaxID=2035199 RepID=UPI000C2C6019|nr:outer membrane beta-barrel protein [Flavobacterium sp. 5]PKB16938.1 outer membrane protein with beta-barrel domain [Flavobacterium sp. 5]